MPLKVDWLLRNSSWQFYLLSEVLLEICCEVVVEAIFFSKFRFVIYFGGLTSNKPARYVLGFGDFDIKNNIIKIRLVILLQVLIPSEGLRSQLLKLLP